MFYQTHPPGIGRHPNIPDPRVVLVSGFIYDDGSVQVQDVIISEQGLPTAEESEGDTQFSLRDSIGNLISSKMSDPPRELTIEGEILNEDGSKSGFSSTMDLSKKRPFVESFVIPEGSGPLVITIEQNGRELASINVESNLFAPMFNAVEALSEIDFRKGKIQHKDKLIEVLEAARTSYDLGFGQESIETLDWTFRHKMDKYLVVEARTALTTLLDDLIYGIREKLETASLRKTIEESSDDKFRRRPDHSRAHLLKQVDKLQSAIDKNDKCCRIITEQGRIRHLIKYLVDRDSQPEFIAALDASILLAFPKSETQSLISLVLPMYSNSHPWYRHHLANYILLGVAKAQTDIDRGKLPKATRKLKTIETFLKRVKLEQKDPLLDEIRKLVELLMTRV